MRGCVEEPSIPEIAAMRQSGGLDLYQAAIPIQLALRGGATQQAVHAPVLAQAASNLQHQGGLANSPFLYQTQGSLSSFNPSCARNARACSVQRSVASMVGFQMCSCAPLLSQRQLFLSVATGETLKGRLSVSSKTQMALLIDSLILEGAEQWQRSR